MRLDCSRAASIIPDALEYRTLLTVSGLFFGGTLLVQSNGLNDSITIRPNPSDNTQLQVLGNGVEVSSIGAVPTSQVQAGSYKHLRAHETVLDTVCRL